MAHQQVAIQAELPLELPVTASVQERMRALFYGRWVRWHRHKRFEDAVADPITRELLELAVTHRARHSLEGRR